MKYSICKGLKNSLNMLANFRLRTLITILAVLTTLTGIVLFLNKNPQLAEAAWYNGAWTYRKKLTFDNSGQSENLTNFPTMVKLTSTNFTFSQAQSSGQDIRFTDSAGTNLLDYEIESFDASGEEAYLWVKVPQIDGSSATDYIYMYWGNPSASDAQDADATWNSNYKGVWHLNDDAATSTVSDSSGNSNNITSSGTTDKYTSTGQMGGSFTTMGTPQVVPNQAGSTSELYPSIKLDSNDYPVIAFFDDTDNDLMLLHCNDPDCKGDDESLEVVESSGNTGYYPSLQLDTNDYPVIAYWDNTGDDLKFVHCDDVNCTGTETPVSLDTVGDTGRWPSMQLDSSGYPTIAYFDNSNDALKLIHCDDADCTSYNTETVDATANSAYLHSISLQLDDNDYPVIAYYHHTADPTRKVKVTRCNDVDCDGVGESTESPVDGANQYRYLSLQLDITDEYPMITYYDETIGDLFYIHCDDANCAGVETPKTLTTGTARQPWMELNSSGIPIIITHYSVYPRLFICSDADCTTDSEQYITLNNQYYCNYPTMELDSNDYPVFACYSRGKTGSYDINLYRLSPKLTQSYDSDFDFGTGDFSASMWFKSDDASQNFLLSRYDADQGYKLWLDYGGHPCFGIDDDSSFGPDDSACTTPANTEVDMDGQGGTVEEHDMKLNSVNGYPVIAFFDETNDDLEVVRCNDATCTSTTTTTIDSSGDVGRTPSLQLDSNNYPVIAYHYNTSQDLKIVHCGSTDCSSGNTINTVDSGGNVGDYPSLQLDTTNGYPVIAYYDATNTAIKLVHCDDVNCDGDESGNTVTVDNTEIDYPYISVTWMKLDTNGYPVMTYHNNTTYDLKLAHCDNAGCTGDQSGNIVTVETSGTIGRYASLELDSNDYPVIATHRASSDLKLIHCSDANCTTKTSNYVEESTNMDKGYYYIDLELNDSGYPVILHTSLAHWNHILTICNDVNCAGSDESFTHIRGSASDYLFSSLELDSNDYPVISYYDSGKLNLLHATATTYTDTNAYDDGSWHHLVAVKDDTSSIKLYIDGAEVASDTSIAALNTLTSDSAELRLAETITVLAGNDYSTYNWSGDIDEVQIDSTARSADWVAAQYLSESDGFITFGTLELGSTGDGEKPVAYWSFDSGYGTVAQDKTTNNIDLEITGAAWRSEEDCFSGKCLYFDGSGDYLRSTDSNVTTIASGASATYSVWFRTGDTTTEANYPNIMGIRDTSSSPYDIFNLRLYQERIEGEIYENDNNDSIRWTTSVIDNQWHHAVLVKNGNTAHLYVDGLLKDSGTRTWGEISDTEFLIGARETTGGYFKGFIDEPKVYDYARTAAQVKTDYIRGAGAHGGSAVLGAEDTSYLNDGLVGYWKLEETSTPAIDSSGNGNSGTWTGDNIDDTAGKFGNSISLGGTDDYVDMGVVGPVDGATALTVSAWVKPDGAVSDSIVDQYGDSSSATFLFYTNSSGLRGLVEDSSSNRYYGSISDAALAVDTWQHVVMTWDADSQTIYGYVNGEKQTNSVSAPISSLRGTAVKNLVIGGTWNDFAGEIDEVRVYQRALSSAEIRALYNWAPGPVLYYSLDEHTGTSTVYDRSGNDYDGTMSGLSESSWVLGKYGSALNFDGNDSVNITGFTSTTKSNTIEMWAKSSLGDTTYDYLLDSTTGRFVFAWFSSVSGQIGFYDGAWKSFGDTPNDGEWHHLALVLNSSTSTASLYIDGVKFGSDQAYTDKDISGDTYLATNYLGTGGYFNGSLDDVRIYNYARTPGQIVEDMNAGHPIGGSPVGSQVGYWKFDEGYGTTAYDSGLHAENGTLTNSPTWSNSGKIGKALSFSDSSNATYVSIPGSGELEDVTDNSYSFSAWMNPASIPSSGTNNVMTAVGRPGYHTLIGYYYTQKMIMHVRNSDGTAFATTSSNTFSIDNWNHVVGVADTSDNSIKIYVNGKLEGTGSWTGTLRDFGTGEYRIGTSRNGSCSADWAFCFDGLVDEAKIYNTTLTQEEILIDYNQGKAMVLGALSTDASGNADFSSERGYCPPGDTTASCSPVGEWKMDEKTGVYAYDTSGNNYTGTLANSPTWVQGKVGAGLDFTRTSSQYVSTADIDITNSFTLEAWAYTTDSANQKAIISKGTGTTTNYCLDLRSADNSIGFFVYDSGGAARGLTGSTTDKFPTNQWTHIVAVYNSASTPNFQVFLNGSAISNTANWTGTMASNDTNTTIGARATGDNFFDGKLDHVKIYDYARSASQIAWDYNRGGPVGWWRFDENQEMIVYDASGNENNGDLEASMTSDDWVEGKYNTALDFDGGDDYVTLTNNLSLDSDNWSISWWMNRNERDYECIFSKAIGSFAGMIEVDHTSYPNQIRVESNTNNEWVKFFSTSIDTTDGQWHHYNLVFGPSNSYLYVDGILTDTETANSDSADYLIRYIGVQQQQVTYIYGDYFQGLLDDVQIFNYALTPLQIENLYNQESAIRFGPSSGSP